MSWLSKVVCCSVLLVGCAEDGALGPPGDPDLTGTATGTLYPCDVANVLATRCFTCHGSTPVGTPMSLASQSVMFETSQTRAGSGQLIGQLVFDRINSPNSPMPPRNAPSGALTDGERALLNDWLDKGAQKAGAEAMSCQPTPPPGAGGTFTGGAGGAPPWTPGSGGTTPVPGSGGTVTSAGGAGVSSGGAGIAPPDGGEPIPVEDTPVPPEPGECNVVKIRARTAGAAAAGVTEGAPYQVPSNYIDKYICFEFDLNLPGPTQALQFKSAVEGPWVHHWLLYRKRPGLAASNGANSECLGVHPDAELLAGWAPGAGDWNLPRHVGMDMGQGKYVLELHYNNLGAPTGDSSGVDVCLTQNLRPQTAGIHWLGSEFLTLPPQQAKDEVSMCRPANQTEPIHVLRWWPHMHLMGRSMRAEIHRADGTKEPVFDEPFDFNNQIQYDIPRVVNPGDSILTTCRFMNTSPNLILFGERTTEEMCYNFVVAYPASSLVSFPQGIHSNSCQGPP